MKPASVEIKIAANFGPFIEGLRQMAAELNALADKLTEQHGLLPAPDVEGGVSGGC